MAAQFYKINYKSDFVLTINSDAGWAVPFCIKFWTGMPSHGYFAGFDGENYVNCRVGETPTQLLVMFDDHHMPVGPLRMQIAYHTTIEEFPDRKFDEVTNPTNVTVDIDGTEYQVMLDFTGETGAEIDFSMPSSGVMSVNGKIGYVTLTAEDVGAQPTIEDLATIRSGAAAGATAVQPAEMTAALATKQDTIPDFANIRSGAAAGATAVQPATLQEGLATKQDVISDLATIRSGAAAGATAVQPAAITPIQTALQTIEAVIPSAATSQNQLADKNFVNSSIATNTANFVGTYNSLAELQAVQNPTNNDYGFVIETDAQGNEYYDRYKYVAASQQWLFEYKVESTPFTAAQWAAIQSGITSALVTKLNALPTNAELQQTLDGKANTSDIPTALSQLSQDSTHRVVTDAEKSTWNGKQNSIDDLATIRSGAAAGATAVQPAAMNTALAAKQDTLTFDNTPTANSSNPVKSSGIKTALDAKQSTISTVNVTVDNNTGTPSGSASVSGSTLSLSFQNLKGATGATGATGPQGPQGERGLPGESGVTGDVSGFTVIQTIDPSATYGATDIAGAATVQATNAELTELAGEVTTTTQTQLEINKLYYATARYTDRKVLAVSSAYYCAYILIDSSHEKFIIKSTDGISYVNIQGIFLFSNVPAVGDIGDSLLDYTVFTNSGNSVEKIITVEPSMVGKYLVISSHNNCNLQVFNETRVNRLDSMENSIADNSEDIDILKNDRSVNVIELIASRNEDGVTGTALNLQTDLSSYENGTHFLLKIINVAGSRDKSVALRGTAFFIVKNGLKTGDNFYFEKTSEMSHIRLYCSSGTNEILNFELYTVKSTPNNNNLLLQPNTLSIEQGAVALGTPMQGKYWATPMTTYTDVSWVCFPIQYSRGYSVHLNIDFATYYLALKLWRDDLSGCEEVHITSETDCYIPLYAAAWHIQIRRIDRATVSTETVINALTCTFVAGSGYKWEKPAPVSYVESLLNEVKEQAGLASTQVGNPFTNKPWIAHYSPNGFIKDGSGNNVIPSESLADIEMAARLGFSFIEANIQQTSDGKYIVIHGSSGTFGPEVKSIDESVITTADLQATAINSKTLEWINTYVRYNSTLVKYQTTIPTLDEFCESCKENNIGIFGGSSQKVAIDTMVRYLGKDNVIVYGPPSNIRTYFSGMVYTWNNSAGTTPETLLINAKTFGAPYMCGVGPTLYSELVANNNLGQFLENMHYNGFLVGHAYLTEADAREAFMMGMDFAAADHEVNPFKGDKVYDLDGNDSDFTTTGSITNNIATLASGQTISCGSSDVLALAKCSLSIRFTGSLTISMGSKWSSNRTITSDGSELIVITDYCYRRNTVLAITATASTTITGLVYKYAVC